MNPVYRTGAVIFSGFSWLISLASPYAFPVLDNRSLLRLPIWVITNVAALIVLRVRYRSGTLTSRAQSGASALRVVGYILRPSIDPITQS